MHARPILAETPCKAWRPHASFAGLLVVSGARAVRAFEKLGYERVRQSSSHVRLVCEGRAPLTAPLHHELKCRTLRALTRDAKIMVEEFVAFLWPPPQKRRGRNVSDPKKGATRLGRSPFLFQHPARAESHEPAGARGPRTHQLLRERLEPLKAGSIIGSYHHVSTKHLDAYVDELEFRYNNRESPTCSGTRCASYWWLKPYLTRI